MSTIAVHYPLPKPKLAMWVVAIGIVCVLGSIGLHFFSDRAERVKTCHELVMIFPDRARTDELKLLREAKADVDQTKAILIGMVKTRLEEQAQVFYSISDRSNQIATWSDENIEKMSMKLKDVELQVKKLTEVREIYRR